MKPSSQRIVPAGVVTEYLTVGGSNSARYIDFYKFNRGSQSFKTVQGRANNAAINSVFQDLSVSPNGLYMVASESNASPFIDIFQRIGDNWIRMTNPATLPAAQVYSVAWSPDSSQFLLGTNNNLMYCYQLINGRFVRTLNLPGTTNTGYDIQWNGTGTSVCFGGVNQVVRVLNYNQALNTFTSVAPWLANPGTIQCDSAGFSPDGTLLATGSGQAPTLAIYGRSGDTFTTATTIPSITRTFAVRFNPAATSGNNILSIPGFSSPFLVIANQVTTNSFTTTGITINVQPAGQVNAGEWSSDGQYLALACNVSPYLYVYARNGNTYTKLLDPVTLPTAAASAVTWISTPNQGPNHSRVGVYYNAIPYYQEYTIDYKNTVTNLPTVIDYNPISAQPTGASTAIALATTASFAATNIGNLSPYVYFYSRAGDTFTKTANPATLPTGLVNGIQFNSSASSVALAHNTTPFVTIYNISGVTFTKITNPTALPIATTGAQNVAWGNGDQNLVVTTDLTPFYINYSRSGDTFTAVATATNLPPSTPQAAAYSPSSNFIAFGYAAGTARTQVSTVTNGVFNFTGTTITSSVGSVSVNKNALAWTSDSRFLAAGMATTPFIAVYVNTGTTFTQLANPATLPAGSITAVAWNYDNSVLYAQQTGGSLYSYNLVGTTLILNTSTNVDYLPTSPSQLAYSAFGV
jgi:hypothetical protein